MGDPEKGSRRPQKRCLCKPHPRDSLGHPSKGVVDARGSGSSSQSWHRVDRVDFLLLFQKAQFSQIQQVSQQPAGFPFPLKA